MKSIKELRKEHETKLKKIKIYLICIMHDNSIKTEVLKKLILSDYKSYCKKWTCTTNKKDAKKIVENLKKEFLFTGKL